MKQIESELKDIRGEEDFAELIDKYFKSSSDTTLIEKVDREAWNNIFTVVGLGRLNSISKVVAGQVTIELTHALGILILVRKI